MELSEKKKIVEDLHERLVKSKIVILTDYKGLNVAAITDLRRKLRAEHIEYKVVKNTLLHRASAETDVALIKDHFKGSTAIAMSFDNSVASAKVLSKFAAENGKFEIKAGVMGGRALDKSSIKTLSELPSREVLLGNLLSVLNGVPTALVVALSDVPRRFINVVNAIKQQKEAA